MKGFLLTILVTLVPLTSHSNPIFFRGRPWRNGLLGKPAGTGRLFSKPPLEEQWITQNLDNFDPSNDQKWKQRYFVNDEYYQTGGPVFLQLGGEGNADPIWLQMGQIATNYGRRMNALLILLEHRYYGQSHPTPDLSTKNLRYLTSEQALADAANFIVKYQQINPSTKQSKWISFGGSYSGSLSAWLRYKYSHLIDGAVASSAPMKAVINFKEYLGVVRDSLGSRCDHSIQQATGQLKELLKHPLGWQEVTQTFQLCAPLNGSSENDVANLLSSLVGNIEGVVQYNKDNREFEGAQGTNITIDTICDIMQSKDSTSLQRYSMINNLILKAYGQKCLDYQYANMIKTMSDISWNASASEGGRQWTYQTCVEFGFFQSSDLRNQPFGHFFPVEFFEQMCTDTFGDKFTVDLLAAGVNFTNAYYGAYDIKLSKVILPNGSVDPWHALGLLNYRTKDSKSVFINGTAHCADLYPDSSEDSEDLKAARNEVYAFLQNIVTKS